MAFNKEKLKVLRLQDELSQAALAQALGVSRSTIPAAKNEKTAQPHS